MARKSRLHIPHPSARPGDKPDFSGKPELMWEAEQGPDRVLVALQPVAARVVPPEASQIVVAGQPRGRITSARLSPSLERSVCLGQVDVELAVPGTEVTIQLPSGGTTTALVMEHLLRFQIG